MEVQRLGGTSARRVTALQVGLAVGLAALAVVAEWSTAPSVQWPVLLLVLVGALMTEHRQREALQPGRLQRLCNWLQRQISDGVVHGHEEGQRCNDLCHRNRTLDAFPQGPARTAVAATATPASSHRS